MTVQAPEAPAAGLAAPARRPWMTASVLAGILALVGLLTWGLTRDARFIPSPLLGREAPPLELTLFSGERFDLADHRGHVVVVNFWASWCTACKEEAPILEAGWRTFRGQGAVFLGVNIQDTREAALDFIRAHGKTYPSGQDPRGEITIDYGVYAVPETFFIDREGRVVHKHFGPITWDVLSAQLKGLL